jgi:hypothetical protein
VVESLTETMPIDDAYVCIDNEALAIERRQAIDEGRQLSALEDEFESVRQNVSEDPLAHQKEARSLLEGIQELPYREGYEYTEPSDLDGIRDERPAGPRQLDLGLSSEDELYDHVLGAWLGRCSGCLLGKPVEGWYSSRLWDFLRDTDNYPMRDYIRADMPDEVWVEYGWDDEPAYHTSFVDEIDYMARDEERAVPVVRSGIVEHERPQRERLGMSGLRVYPTFRILVLTRPGRGHRDVHRDPVFRAPDRRPIRGDDATTGALPENVLGFRGDALPAGGCGPDEAECAHTGCTGFQYCSA